MFARLFGSKNKPRYSIEDFHRLYNELISITEYSKRSSERLIEILRIMAEIVIWGEQNDEDFFMYFCEKNIL